MAFRWKLEPTRWILLLVIVFAPFPGLLSGSTEPCALIGQRTTGIDYLSPTSNKIVINDEQIQVTLKFQVYQFHDIVDEEELKEHPKIDPESGKDYYKIQFQAYDIDRHEWKAWVNEKSKRPYYLIYERVFAPDGEHTGWENPTGIRVFQYYLPKKTPREGRRESSSK